MNLRNVAKEGINYNIGLDLGTGSVGWAVTDKQGELFSFKGKTTWGKSYFSYCGNCSGYTFKARSTSPLCS